MRYSAELRSRLTRERLASLWAATYGRLRGLDPNEASLRLEAAFRNPRLLGAHQDAVVRGLWALHPEATEAELVQRLDKKDRPRRRFPAPARMGDDGAWVAWSLEVDRAAGVASGEADGLLETPDGQRLAADGLERAGRHGAERLLK